MSSQSPVRLMWLAHACSALCGILLVAAPASAAAGDANQAVCPPQTEYASGFRPELPDCRAYELVSPAHTNGQPLGAQGVSADGTTVGFSSLGDFGGAGDDENSEGALYVASRSESSGWGTAAVEPSAAQFQDEFPSAAAENRMYSADLTETLFSLVPTAATPIDFRYYRRARSGVLVEVGPTVSPSELKTWIPAEGAPPLFLLGAASDLSHVLFTPQHGVGPGGHWFWPGDTTVGKFSLYEYAGAGNSEPVLVDVKPGPEETRNRPAEHPRLISQCGAMIGGANLRRGNGVSRDTYNAVSELPASEEGRTIFFTAFADNEECAGAVAPPTNEVYARVGGVRTVAISEPSKEACEACDTTEAAQNAAPEGALFQGASGDGSRVFFLSEQKLFDGSRGETGRNLYEYDLNAGSGNKVFLIAPRMASGGGVMRVSSDGSRVYFVSQQSIASTGANEFGLKPSENADNLYVYDARAHQATFITALSEEDSEGWSESDGRQSISATPDGRFLVFGSAVEGVTPGAAGGGHQLYRYNAAPTKSEAEAATPRLTRLSIGDAQSNDGNNGAFSFTPTQGYVEKASYGQPVSISADGSRVFFESSAALTSRASNEACTYEEGGECLARAQNVYEYENGHVYLISDGRDAHSNFRGSAVQLIGTSLAGNDVYFTSDNPLVGQGGETGQTYIYDARVDGGFLTPPPLAGCASQCQGIGSTPPVLGPPASMTLTGVGNAPAPAVLPMMRAQGRAARLAKALKVCRARHSTRKARRDCERRAQATYGPRGKKPAHKAASRRS